MSSQHRRRSIVTALLVTALWCGSASAAAEKPLGTVNVNVKTAKVRVEPRVWSTAVVGVKYGDTLQALSSSDGWLKVRTSGGKQGYLHQSAVTDKKIVLAARGSGGDVSADRSDVVLAGKGFNKAVEQDLAAQDGALNFKAVDEMERVRVSDGDLAAFIKNGQLGKRG